MRQHGGGDIAQFVPVGQRGCLRGEPVDLIGEVFVCEIKPDGCYPHDSTAALVVLWVRYRTQVVVNECFQAGSPWRSAVVHGGEVVQPGMLRRRKTELFGSLSPEPIPVAGSKVSQIL